MLTLLFEPEPRLRSFVQFIAYVEGNDAGICFPKLHNELLINVGDAFHWHDSASLRPTRTATAAAWVTGLQRGPVVVSNSGQARMYVVRLESGAVPYMLAVPASALDDRFVPLRGLIPDGAADLPERLREVDSPASGARVIEACLLELLRAHEGRIGMQIEKAKLLANAIRSTTVRALGVRVGCSRATLNRTFKYYFGLSPKRYQRLYRFNEALRMLADTRKRRVHGIPSLYYDQPHFIRDFKDWTGLTPNHYRRLARLHSSMSYAPNLLPSLTIDVG